MRKKEISIEKVLKTVSTSARRKAFRNDLPVAISEGGRTILLYPDGRREDLNAKSLARLLHGKA
jgi:hypothetical protein